METAFHPLIYLIVSVSNANRYSAFRSLKNAYRKKADSQKPSKIKGSGHAHLRDRRSHAGGETESKKGEFEVKLVIL